MDCRKFAGYLNLNQLTVCDHVVLICNLQFLTRRFFLVPKNTAMAIRQARPRRPHPTRPPDVNAVWPPLCPSSCLEAGLIISPFSTLFFFSFLVVFFFLFTLIFFFLTTFSALQNGQRTDVSCVAVQHLLYASLEAPRAGPCHDASVRASHHVDSFFVLGVFVRVLPLLVL